MGSSVRTNFLKKKPATCLSRQVYWSILFCHFYFQCSEAYLVSENHHNRCLLYYNYNQRPQRSRLYVCSIFIFIRVESGLFKRGILFWEVLLCFRPDALNIFISYFAVVFSFNLHIYYSPLFKNKWKQSPVHQLRDRIQSPKFSCLLWSRDEFHMLSCEQPSTGGGGILSSCEQLKRCHVNSLVRGGGLSSCEQLTR
jgi:hypothetical protein